MLQEVAVVGVGAVGQACAFALMLRGSAREIVLVDRIADRAAAVATDMATEFPCHRRWRSLQGIGATSLARAWF